PRLFFRCRSRKFVGRGAACEPAVAVQQQAGDPQPAEHQRLHMKRSAAARVSTCYAGSLQSRAYTLHSGRFAVTRLPYTTGSAQMIGKNGNRLVVSSSRTTVRNMESPSAKGAHSEAAILHALVASGKSVRLPWAGHHRYDFVLDEGDGQFTRVQCK